MSVIANFVATVAEEIIQSVVQVKVRLISPLIKGSSRVLQKLLKYSNGTATSTSFVTASRDFFSVIHIVDSSNSEFTVVPCGSSL